MFDILTFLSTICKEANVTIQLLGCNRTDSWSGPQGLLHSPALSFPMVPLHPGWSWLPCLLPAGPLSSTLLKGRGSRHQGGEQKQEHDEQPGGEGGAAFAEVEEQRKAEEHNQWPRIYFGTLLFS